MSVFQPEKPYNELSLLPPQFNFETPAILKACIKAHRELAKLNMAAKLIPNQTVLVNCLPLLESQASSAIENIITSTDELFQFAESKAESQPLPVKETLYYRSALFQGIHSLKRRPLSITTVCDICSTLRGIKEDVRKTPGTTLVNNRTGAKIYTPPEGEKLLRDLLANWQNYIHREDTLDLLVKLAVQHYQFEAIHPFTDGNGRTGRIINLLFLIDKGLLEQPILYLSRYINNNKTDYYSLLLNVTVSQAWEEWVMYFLEAVTETSQWTIARILAIQELINESCKHLQEKVPQFYTKELVELLFNQPYVRIEHLVEHHIAERQTASRYLQKLCEIDFLDEIKVGREKLFINKRFLNLLKAQ